jgi:RNA polymerase sigma-70 factor, ECF subfamily
MLLRPIVLAVRGAEADAELFVRLQRREPQALAELYDRYGRIAYALILRVVRDTGIAEDLVQETFLRVWNRLQTFDAQKGAVGPWLLAVAHNRAIDYLRSAGGRERNAVEFKETDHPSLYTDIERSILTSDKARVVKAAIEKLSSHQRQVIELAYFEGISQTEMAVRIGQPLGTVKTWVRAALNVLRDELGAQAARTSRDRPVAQSSGATCK